MLVVGGGIQGLVVMREVVAAGYSALLVTKDPVGAGQTLHSHGLLNSGAGLLTGLLRSELEMTLRYLRELGVPVYGRDSSFLALPPAAAADLLPMWEANGYAPTPVDRQSVPGRLELPGEIYRVEAINVDKRSLVRSLCNGMDRLIMHGEVVQVNDGVEVRRHVGGSLSLHPRAVVVAAGCGTKRLLTQDFGIDDARVAAISYTKPHMICLRGSSDVLPEVGTLLLPDLIVVGHPGGGDGRAGGHSVTWYVTPKDPAAPPRLDAPDDAVATVDEEVVRRGLEQLNRLFRPPTRSADLHGTVFAGYKQDYEGQPIKRACELVDPQRNLLMVLPSVLANAVPNAVDVLGLLRDRIGAPEHGAVPPDAGEAITVGDLPESAPEVQWAPWDDFARAYGVDV